MCFDMDHFKIRVDYIFNYFLRRLLRLEVPFTLLLAILGGVWGLWRAKRLGYPRLVTLVRLVSQADPVGKENTEGGQE